MNIFSQPMYSHIQYVHNTLKCSNNSKHSQCSGIKLTEHTLYMYLVNENN